MMYTIENKNLRVVINPVGAELSSLVNKTSGLEYLWSGDPVFWAKKSPVLFPIVGTLKDNSYFVNDKKYHLSRHGFAREKTFTVVNASPVSISFELKSDESTLEVYPFQFSFSIIYTIEENSMSVSYLVKNTGDQVMYFSVGGHPAFKMPIADSVQYEDYYLLFNKTENAGHYPIDANGLLEKLPLPLLQNTNRLPLTKSLFYKDALVLKDLRSDEVQIKSDQHPAGLRFKFEGFPYLGIWAAKEADFVCIEPWCGIADVSGTSQQLNEKEGIQSLPQGDEFLRTWSVACW
ncbi:MAG: aldose 1-epimerase family protein [Ferruginibacter sp.]